MRVEQHQWTGQGWRTGHPGQMKDAHLVLLFGSTELIKEKRCRAELSAAYPSAYFVGCSTAGEICDVHVSDDTLVATAIHFEHTRVEACSQVLSAGHSSREAGRALAERLEKTALVHVFVLSDGLSVNGSELVAGLTQGLPKGVTVTGGLSGDGTRFDETFVLTDWDVRRDAVTVIGFYSEHLRVGYGSLGGWDPFGPERLVTRAAGNILYELDRRSALELYKAYLGEHAEGLPATGLLFPLSIRKHGESNGLVRTILAVDEQSQSLTFAGDIAEGSLARLMMANINRLVDGASDAAKRSMLGAAGSTAPDLAVLISCVGRKMVLKQRVEEEVEAVREVLGESTVIAGFYSYGEVSPFSPNARCELHNQTMTITSFTEL